MTDQLSYEPPRETLMAAPSRLDVAVIAVRLIGCYLMLQVVLLMIPFLPGLFSSLEYSSSPWLEVAASLGIVAGATVAGVCLVVFAESIGRRLLPRGGGAPSAGASDTTTWQAIAFAVLGIYFVASSLPRIIVNVGDSVTHEHDLIHAFMMTDLLEIAVGLLLFFQARGLARLWHKLRTAGAQPVGDRE